MKQINAGNDRVTKNNTFIFPKDTQLSGEELLGFIGYNEGKLGNIYRRNMKLYLGNHPILHDGAKETGADNRIVVNMPKYLVDTYNGFFSGIPPKITLNENTENEKLQDWNNTESFFDKLNEISKQADIYGRSYGFIYQDEDGQTHVQQSSPAHSFIVYDSTVKREPLAFVRYQIESGKTYTQATGTIQYADKFYRFDGSNIELDDITAKEGLNPYGIVPAVEFFENEERQGVFDSVVTLIKELDKAISQKANQVEYFDNAYLAMIGVQLDESQLDEKGNPEYDFRHQRVMYLPNVDPNCPNPRIEFISKPDNDQMQENLIQRVWDAIFQMSMVPNLNDQAFSGNSSGVALEYKLLPMRNKASNKERKFKKSLRSLYRIVFSALFGENLQDQDLWQDLKFIFKRNLPDNVAEEITSAKNADGLVSKETQLGLLSFVDDPQKELERMQEEKSADMQMALNASPSATDFQKNQEEVKSDDDEQEEPKQK